MTVTMAVKMTVIAVKMAVMTVKLTVNDTVGDRQDVFDLVLQIVVRERRPGARLLVLNLMHFDYKLDYKLLLKICWD